MLSAQRASQFLSGGGALFTQRVRVLNSGGIGRHWSLTRPRKLRLAASPCISTSQSSTAAFRKLGFGFLGKQPLTPQKPRTMCIATSKTVNLLVVSGKDAPELEVLQSLPECVSIIGVGRSVAELSHLTPDKWQSVEVMVNCGLLANAATKDSFQEIFALLTNLKWVHSVSVGVEHILSPALEQSGVILTNARGVYSHSLAEYALTACNWFAKDLPRLQAAKKARKWDPFEVEELRGMRLGVVGLGDIGKAVAKLARAFKMKVVGLRRNTNMSEEEKKEGLVDKIYSPEELCSLMADCDYVVTALPYTPKTRKFITRDAIRAMKSNGVFINVGRGKTVDEDALVEALQNNRIRGAGLDVFETEPLTRDSPLYDLDNVFMSPHCADRTKMFQHEALELFVQNVGRYVAGDKLMNVVDKAAGY